MRKLVIAALFLSTFVVLLLSSAGAAFGQSSCGPSLPTDAVGWWPGEALPMTP